MNDKVKKALISIGFSEQAADSQMRQFGEIVQITILERILKDNSQDKDLIVKDIEAYCQSHYSQEQLKQMFEEIVSSITKKYFDEITKDLSDEKKQQFLDLIIT